MFRDFIYLDTDRIQSIIAQLQEGLLTEIITADKEEVAKNAGISFGVISQFLPFSFSVEGRNGSENQRSKILHDHAFNVALGSLREQGYLLIADDLDPDIASVPEAAFVLVRGTAKIFDYSTFQNLAEHEKDLDKILSNKPPENRQQRRNAGNRQNNKSMFGEIKVLVDAFFKDAIQVRVTNRRDVSFVGPFTRGHLREDIRDIIFKYGSKPQGEWTMLAEINRSPSQGESASQQLETATLALENVSGKDIRTASNVLNEVLDVMNSFQEVISSAAYPDVSVSPIALYREVHPIQELD